MRIRTAMAALGAAAAASCMLVSGESSASSHREAPFITKNPKVDGTDFYMFQSYGDGRRDTTSGASEYTTLIANYIPLQDSYGGPNYFSFDPEALYEIHVENSGDAVEDITFQFQFKNALNPVSPKGVALDVGGKSNSVPTIQANVGQTPNATPITTANATGAFPNGLLNVQESYTINVVRGARRSVAGTPVTNAASGAATFAKPVDYIGTKTLGNAAAYAAYAAAHKYPVNIPGCDTPGQVFVGQRKESFRVNLGTIFDLVNAPLGVITSAGSRDLLTGSASDVLQNKNVSSIALEVPTKCLTADGKTPSTTARSVIGGWTTASVRQARVINPKATYDKPAKEGGAWAQVSRLGMPLTNEVVIGIADKDRWNSSEPKDDAQFADYVTNPTLPQILQAIFGGASAPTFPAATLARTDLVAIFLTGLTGVNATGSTAEMLRLNTALPTQPSTNQSDLGAASCYPYLGTGCTGADINACLTLPATLPTGCNTAGFPNGRRPGDDVVDIELTTLLGYFIPKGNGANQAPIGGTPLHDAVLNNVSQFDANFPYLRNPIPGAGGGG